MGLLFGLGWFFAERAGAGELMVKPSQDSWLGGGYIGLWAARHGAGIRGRRVIWVRNTTQRHGSDQCALAQWLSCRHLHDLHRVSVIFVRP